MTPEQIAQTVRERAGDPPVSIDAAELDLATGLLGFALPPSYRDFMGRVGPIDWPVELLRPAKVAAMFAAGNAGLPPHLIEIGEGPGGGLFCLDRRYRDPLSGELAICFYDPEEPPEPDEVPAAATSLWELLEEEILDREIED